VFVLYTGAPGGTVIILGRHRIGHSKYVSPIPNGFRDRAISLYRGTTRHVLTRLANCIDVVIGNFENVLH
jgi:hypothetical protein